MSLPAALSTTAQLRERLALLSRSLDSKAPAVRSGFAQLDTHLPCGGWPVGALTELLSDTVGIGELGLLLPALTSLAQQGRYLLWIAPPYLPYAPALAQRGLALERVLLIEGMRPQDALWAAEQALRCPAIGAVLSWSTHIVDRSLRRLQLAAEAGGTLGILHRPADAVREPSPAALRLALQASPRGLCVEIKKARGGRPGERLYLETSHAVARYSFPGADV